MQNEIREFNSQLDKSNVDIQSLLPQIKATNECVQNKRSQLDSHEINRRKLETEILELENFEYPEFSEIDVLVRKFNYLLKNLCVTQGST